MENFAQLGVNKDLIKGLNELGINTPTEIQREVIPLLLSNHKDLIGQAQTGMGKTAAYGLPLLQKIDPENNKVQGLILCPTRELGQQVAKQLFKFTKYSAKIFTEAVYGGEKIDRQIAALKRPTQIIVATPGRLIDLVNRKAVDLSEVRTIILDEADEMLSMGFKKELNQILEFLPNADARWLFSATMPTGIQNIIKIHMASDALRIQVSGKNIVNQNISHRYLVCEQDEKLYALIQFLQSENDRRGVVFCKTKAATQKLSKQLQAKNISCEALHGDLLQKERDKVMRAFKKNNLRILVSTDVAARGIDVPGLAFVAHYQLPESDEYYTHRSGRTARAGKKGVSMSFVNYSEARILRDYEQTLGIKFEQIKVAK